MKEQAVEVWACPACGTVKLRRLDRAITRPSAPNCDDCAVPNVFTQDTNGPQHARPFMRMQEIGRGVFRLDLLPDDARRGRS